MATIPEPQTQAANLSTMGATSLPPWPKIPGINLLLMGMPGAGKTYSLRTLMDTELEVFCVFLDQHAMALFTDTPVERFHWVYVPAAKPGWAAMLENAKKINQYSYEDLAGFKQGLNKQAYSQLLDVINACYNFKCQRCGKEFGPVDAFDNHRVLVIDGLTGISTMARDLTIGAKPALHQGEWSVAMNQIERLITMWTADCLCHFILLAHMERQTDMIVGGVKHVVNTLGQKLAPTIPSMFSDFVLAVKNGKDFTWNTLSNTADLKAQNLPLAEKLLPSFQPLIERWKQRVDK